MATSPNQPINPDDSLPPVEPPSAAFLVQLFLVPGVIVAIIVCVWLAFHWLAHLGNDPQAYVRTLRRANEGRWQAALNLANDLRGPTGSGLKSDTKLASELGSILDDEVGSGRIGEQSETLRLYLCRALGEFTVPEASPALVRRVIETNDDATTQAAVEALAVLSTNLENSGRSFRDQDAVVDGVLSASMSTNSGVRNACGFTLGVLGGEKSVAGLLRLLGDPATDVRSNAALGLARLGQTDAYETLSEMLSRQDVVLSSKASADEMQSERYKRALIVVNALRGVTMLVDATNQPPPTGVTTLIKDLQQDSVAEIRSSAAAVILKINRIVE
ncbi:MAG: HEAT repeat domain-containing protein [Planctomycetaceae bacterium]|nr:HEAT repeat domain-containing protein [Planctomycetaceae bacterium]